MKGRGAVVARCASIAVVLLAACGGQVSQTGTGGSETNWLRACTKVADCLRGDCVCGVCTLACSDSASCAAGPPSSTCAVAGSSALAALCASEPVPAGACLLPCTTTCPSGSTCVADHCVPDVRGSVSPIDAGGAKDAAARDATPSDASVSPIEAGGATDAPAREATASDASPAPDGDAIACTGPIGTKSIVDVSTWYAGGDGTGTQTPSFTGGRACLSGSGFTSWGTLIGLSRNGPTGANCTYDLSSYTGITFTISGTIPNGYLWFVAPLPGVTLDRYGRACVQTSALCDNYGIQVPISAQPQPVTVAFSQLTQEGWKYVEWDPSHIVSLQWEIRPNETGSVSSFADVCVSDVQLY